MQGMRTLPVGTVGVKTDLEKRVFFPALDGLRALAFTMVFLQHYAQMPWGWTGVDLFFVLSGFLITGILFDSRNAVHRIRNFYIRRTLRIFPLYYGIMLALFLSSPLLHWRWSLLWLAWPTYLGNFLRFVHPYLYLSPLQRLADFQPLARWGQRQFTPFFLGHFWSLCVEEQFYLIWPWIVFSVRDRLKLMWICAGAIPICLILRIYGQHSFPYWMLDGEILYRATPFRVDALLLGGLLALWLRGERTDKVLRYLHLIFPFALVVVVSTVILLASGHIFRVPYPYPSWKFTWGLTSVDLMAALLLLECLHSGSLVNRVLSLRALRWLGRISYGAYVFHDIPHPIYAWIAMRISPHHQTALIVVISSSATLLISWLSFRFYESPFLELKERWTSPRQGLSISA